MPEPHEELAAQVDEVFGETAEKKELIAEGREKMFEIANLIMDKTGNTYPQERAMLLANVAYLTYMAAWAKRYGQ